MIMARDFRDGIAGRIGYALNRAAGERASGWMLRKALSELTPS
jgi:hypothetical protein